jgi:hypothetical protein
VKQNNANKNNFTQAQCNHMNTMTDAARGTPTGDKRKVQQKYSTKVQVNLVIDVN